jgi:hypothetical protein
MNLSEMLKKLRDDGWTVASHNDYRLNGESFTFWLFTNMRTGRFVQGEAKTDEEALQNIRIELLEREADESFKKLET